MANVTLKDIAREANLSATTVSQILNGRKINHASPESRKLVLDIAKRLNYRPNLSARQLVTRKNNIIGILIDTMSPLAYRDVLTELEHIAFERGMRLQVGMIHDNLEAIKNYINDFHGSGVRTIICAAHSYPDFGMGIPALLEGFERLVFLEEPLAPTPFPYVASDHYKNYYGAVELMLQKGYRNIYSLRHDYHDKAFSASYAGMKQAFLDSDIEWQESFWRLSKPEILAGELTELVAAKAEVIIADSDMEILKILKLLRSMSLRVPDDICLFSAESSPFAADITPSLAGFKYQPELMAQKIFACLDAQAEGNAGILSQHITATIYRGESCPL